MANIDNVQLPDGSSYNIVDNTSGFASQSYVDSAVSSITKTTIGLGNVDNTSDLSKPVSTAQQTAIDNAVAPKAEQTLIAPVESATTASQTYQIGDQFIYNGLLYKATAVINSGGTITPNGNCTLSNTLVEQIASGADRGYVEVVGDGSKSYKTLLSELSALIDGTKITHNTALKIGNFTYRLLYEQGSSYLFSFVYADTTSTRIQSANVAGSNSTLYLSVNNSITNMTNNAASNGTKFTLYY